MSLIQLKKTYLSKKIPKAQYIEDMFTIHKYLYEYADFIKHTDIKKIEIEEGGVIMTSSEGLRILCNRHDRRVAPIEILNFGSYEPADSKMMCSLIENGQTIFDIGANFGWYSLLFGKKFPESKIIAFEPIKDTFDYLKKNIKLNNAKNVQPYNTGFSDKKGLTILYSRETESGVASMANLKDDKNAKKIICKITTLDDFSKGSGIAVDFVKCDVEGAELLVFKGGVETIKKFRPVVFAEMLRKWSAKFDYHPNEIIEFFKNLGYACFYERGGKLKKILKITESTKATNFFFLNVEKHAKKIKQFTAS